VSPSRNWTTFRIGLTGGIATGKSLVARLFAELGVPVIDTDLIAREIVTVGSPALAELVSAFGGGILKTDGTLDRAALRAVAFRDPGARQRLDAITHPRIVTTLEARSRTTGGPYQVLVVPLLFEAGLQDRVDRVLVVDCPEEEQRRRLMSRDGASAESAERLLSAQLSRTERLARGDDVLDNSGTPDEARERVAELHARYLKLARMNAS
jgi:dephospho-CoA kinase